MYVTSVPMYSCRKEITSDFNGILYSLSKPRRLCFDAGPGIDLNENLSAIDAARADNGSLFVTHDPCDPLD